MAAVRYYWAHKADFQREIRQYCPDALIVLVGTKLDLRNNEYISPNITKQKGDELKKKIGAVAYVECSAKYNQSVDNVFDVAIRTFLRSMKHNQNCCSLLWAVYSCTTCRNNNISDHVFFVTALANNYTCYRVHQTDAIFSRAKSYTGSSLQLSISSWVKVMLGITGTSTNLQFIFTVKVWIASNFIEQLLQCYCFVLMVLQITARL